MVHEIQPMRHLAQQQNQDDTNQHGNKNELQNDLPEKIIFNAANRDARVHILQCLIIPNRTTLHFHAIPKTRDARYVQVPRPVEPAQ